MIESPNEPDAHATSAGAGDSKPLVQRARSIVMQPSAEWPRIDAEPATIAGIYRSYVVILAAIPPLAYAVGMILFGVSVFGVSFRPSTGGVIAYAVVMYLLSLASIYVIALIIDALEPSFGGT